MGVEGTVELKLLPEDDEAEEAVEAVGVYGAPCEVPFPPIDAAEPELTEPDAEAAAAFLRAAIDALTSLCSAATSFTRAFPACIV